MICSIYHIRIQPDPVWHRDSIGSSKPMQESSRGADHGSDLRLHVSLYAGNCSEHVCTLLIGYRSGGTPGFHTSSGRVTEIAGRRRGSSASSALATSRLFVLPVVARRWVSVDNTRIDNHKTMMLPPYCRCWYDQRNLTSYCKNTWKILFCEKHKYPSSSMTWNFY